MAQGAGHKDSNSCATSRAFTAWSFFWWMMVREGAREEKRGRPRRHGSKSGNTEGAVRGWCAWGGCDLFAQQLAQKRSPTHKRLHSTCYPKRHRFESGRPECPVDKRKMLSRNYLRIGSCR